MKNYRLTFNSSTNLSLPEGVYRILYFDASYYGFKKNNKPNISGFINCLIPSLSSYQDDLHNRILNYTKNNEKIARIVEQCILNVYLSPFNFKDDIKINVPFRINKEYYEDFTIIHDVKLQHYKTDFTSFIRNLLVEYATKTSNQRDYLYYYKKIKKIREAINNNSLCYFYTDDNKYSIFPVAIDVSPISGRTLIVGFDEKTSEILIIKLFLINNLVVDYKNKKFRSENYDKILDCLKEYYRKENDELSSK